MTCRCIAQLKTTLLDCILTLVHYLCDLGTASSSANQCIPGSMSEIQPIKERTHHIHNTLSSHYQFFMHVHKPNRKLLTLSCIAVLHSERETIATCCEFVTLRSDERHQLANNTVYMFMCSSLNQSCHPNVSLCFSASPSHHSALYKVHASHICAIATKQVHKPCLDCCQLTGC